jgi:hypothetical protein
MEYPGIGKNLARGITATAVKPVLTGSADFTAGRMVCRSLQGHWLTGGAGDFSFDRDCCFASCLQCGHALPILTGTVSVVDVGAALANKQQQLGGNTSGKLQTNTTHRNRRLSMIIHSTPLQMGRQVNHGCWIANSIPFTRLFPGSSDRTIFVVNDKPLSSTASRSACDGNRSWPASRHNPPGAKTL